MLRALLLSFLGACILFGLTECTVGYTTDEPQSTVRGKHYRPAYWTTSCTSDGKSGTRCTQHYHPEEFLVYVDCSGSIHSVSTTVRTYYSVREGQSVHLAHRDGRWTGIHYVHWFR